MHVSKKELEEAVLAVLYDKSQDRPLVKSTGPFPLPRLVREKSQACLLGLSKSGV